MGSCSIKQVTEGKYEGPMDGLPGCNAITYGPAPAPECDEGDPLPVVPSSSKKAAPAPAPTTSSSSVAPVVSSTSSTVDALPSPVASSSMSLLDSGYFGHKGVLVASQSSSSEITTSSEVTTSTPPATTPTSDPYLVIDTVYVTHTYTKVVAAKRSAVPEPAHKRHAHGHRGRRWF